MCKGKQIAAKNVINERKKWFRLKRQRKCYFDGSKELFWQRPKRATKRVSSRMNEIKNKVMNQFRMKLK